MSALCCIRRLLVLLLLIFCAAPSPGQEDLQTEPRYISAAPSVTEILYALGVDDRIVAVSDFCRYPSGAQSKPAIGNLLDIHYEHLLRLRPTRVFAIDHQRDLVDFCRKQSIPLTAVQNAALSDIQNSILHIGAVVGRTEKARALAAPLAPDRTPPSPAVPALLVVERMNAQAEAVTEVFAAGADTFYDELMTLTGLTNVITSSQPPYAQISREGILSLKPEVIIELIPDNEAARPDRARRIWEQSFLEPFLPETLYIALVTDYAVIPGPRIVRLLEDFTTIRKQALTP